MATKAMTIRDAVETLLTTPALTGIGAGGVQVDPDYAFKSQDLPLVAVYLGDEQCERGPNLGQLTHHMQLNVRVIGKGADAFGDMDALVALVHGRVAADPTIGGLALDSVLTGIGRARDVLEVQAADTELRYLVDYTTSDTSLEA